MIRPSLILILAASAFVACGGSSGGDSGGGSPTTNTSTGNGTGTATSTAWTDTAMQELVSSRCATSGCHDGSQRPKYKGISEAAMKSDSEALSQVNRGRMPRNGSLTATELTTFNAFFNN